MPGKSEPKTFSQKWCVFFHGDESHGPIRNNGLIKGEAPSVGIHVRTKTRPRLRNPTTRWMMFGCSIYRPVVSYYKCQQNHFWVNSFPFLMHFQMIFSCSNMLETFTMLETQSRRCISKCWEGNAASRPHSNRTSDSIRLQTFRQLGSQIRWKNLVKSEYRVFL